MVLNNAEKVRQTLLVHASGDEDLNLQWSANVPETPMDDARPAQLKVKNADGILLTTIFAFEDGFNTILEALGTNADKFARLWTRDYSPSNFRIRRNGEGFEVRHIS